MDLGETLVGQLVDLELEPLALADLGDPGEAEPREGTGDGIASMNNTGINIAFLREFLYDPKTPWVHYDIAGAEFAEKDPKRGNEEFATGFGVKDLYMLARSVAEGKVSPNATDSQT